MSENVNQIFQKKYGSRAEVYNGIALSTRGQLKKENLFVDENGVLQSKKQVDSLKAKTVNSNLTKTSVEVREEDDNTGDEKDLTKAVDLNSYNCKELKDLITQMCLANGREPPKMLKLKKCELIKLAQQCNC